MTFGEAYNFADKIADEIIGGTREMSERYKILDAIMANPDPMIRQRLEMAYDAGRVSVLHEKNVFADDKDFDCAVTFQTAFTNRDNATLTARVAELEQENAKLLDEVEARRFTDDLPLKDRIKELDAELLADGVTMITHPPTAPPAEKDFGMQTVKARREGGERK